MKVKVLLVAIFALGFPLSLWAQINPYIPLMGRQPQINTIGPQQIYEIEAARAQRAQRELMEEQARVLRQQNSQSPPPAASAPPKHVQDWLKAAQPRLYLFPDFDSVVFAPDVSISDDMIRLMSGSTYAADIAYYFGKNKTEAKAVYDMQLMDASKAISKIETRIKANPRK